jgi:O-antigen ligase
VLVKYIFINKKYKIGLGLFALFITIPILMYLLVPTVRNKVGYMVEDISMFLQGKGAANYSDTNRLVSMQLGASLGLSAPVAGIGVGDVRDEMIHQYSVLYPEVAENNRLIPHNQFVYIFAATGFCGLFVFSYFCFYPLAIAFRQKGFLFLSHGSIVITSYISEATLENQLGVTMYIFFYLLTYSLENTKAVATADK